ncbi:serine-rich adhesin for platelets-like [Argopecten irradians]|uniref:serine-rich adhesin for platelets-like n=1 Tax=Argopecten irradians TaxID=31199 RepID=UPI00371D16E3
MANIPSLGVGVVATSAELLSNKEEADIKVEGEIEMPHTEVTGTLEIENQNEREIVVETVTEQEQEERKNVATSDEATDIETTNDSKEDNTESDDIKKTDSIETTDISHAPEDKEKTDSNSDIDANIEMTTTLEDGVAASAAESQSNEVSVDIKVDGEIDMPQTEVSANLEIANQNEQEICVETVSGQHQQDRINVATSDEATDIETTNDSNERGESSTEIETVKSTDGQSDKDDIDDNAESDKTDRNDSSVEASMETIPSLGVDVPASSAELLSNQEAVDIKVEEEVELPHTNVTGTLEIETDVSKEREESQTEVETAKSNDDQSENDDINDNTIIDNTDKNDSTETTDISNESLDNEETDAKYSVEASMANIPSLGMGVAATSAELLSNQEEVDIKVEGEIELPHTEVTGTLEIENQNEQEIVVETVLGQEQEESKNVATSNEATDIVTINDSKEDNIESDDTKKADSIETTDISHAPEDKEETDSKSSIDANVEMTTTLEDGVAASAAESQSNEVSVDIKVNGDIDMPQTDVSANLEIGNQNEREIVVETVSGQEQEESKNVATSNEATDIETSNDSKEDNTENDDTKKKDSIETTDMNAVPEDKEEKDAKSSFNGNIEITFALEDDVAASSTESQSSEESVNIKVDGEIDLPQSEVTGSLEIETDVCKEREESSTEVETVKSTDGQSDKDDIDDNAENDKTDRNESSVEASMKTIPPLGVGIVASSSELLLNQEAVDIKDKGEIELPHTDVTGSLEIETDVCKERENSPTEVETAKSTDEQSEKDDMHDDTKIDNTDKNDSTETTDTSNGSLDKEETDAKYSVEASMANIPSLGVGVVATSEELLSNKEEEQEESKNVATSDEATDIETTNDSKEDNTESDDTKKKDSIETTDISHAPEDKEETDSKSSIDANVEMTKTLEDGVAAYAAESQSNEVSVDIKVDGEIDIPQTEVSANLEIENQNKQDICVETLSGQHQQDSINVATSDEATDIETTNDSKEDNTESDDTKKTDSIETTDINAVPEDKEEKDAKSSLNGNVEITSALEDDVAASTTESQSSEESVNNKVDGEIDLPQSEVTGSLEIETDVCKEREESSTEVETVKSTDGQSDKDDIDDNAESDKTDRNESSVEASMETISSLGVGVAASSLELLSNQEAVDIKVEGEIELPHTDVTGTSEIETDLNKEREESPTEVQTAKSNDDQSENDDMHDNTKIDNTDKNDSTETTDTSNESLDKEETDAKSSVEASMANIPSLGVGVVATSAELLSNQEEVDIKVEGEIELPHTEVTGTLEIENQNEQELVVETVLGQEQEESKNVATSNEATDIETTNDSKEDNTESDDTKKKDSIETTDISHAPEDKEETDSKSSIDANVEMTTTLEDGVAASAAESQSNEVSVDIKVDGEIDMPQTEVSANLEIENQNKQDICVETLSGQHQQDSINVATSDEATDIETSNDSKEDNTESDDTKKKDSIETTDMNAVPEDKEEKDAKSSLNGNVEITSALEDDVAASSTEFQSSEESVNIKVDGEIDLPQSEVTGSLEIETDVCKEREESSTEVETVKSTDGQSDKDDIDDNAESDKTDRNESSVEASMETIPSLGVDVPASSAELLSNQEAVDIKVEGEIELPHTDVTGTSEIETDLNKEREESPTEVQTAKSNDDQSENDDMHDNTNIDNTDKNDSTETTDTSNESLDKEETDAKSSVEASMANIPSLGVGVTATSAELLSNQEEVDIKVEGEIELPHTEVTGTLEIENQNEQVVETVSGQEQEESKNVATSDEATDIETTNDSKEDNTESDDTKKKDSIETTDISHAPEDKEETDSKSSIDANVEMTTTLEDGVAAYAAESQSNEVSVDIKVDGEIDIPQTEVSANLEIENQNKQDICVETLSGQHQQDSINVATSDEATDIETTNDSKEDNTESDDTKKTDSIETTDINAVPEDKEEKDAKSSLNGNVEITSALEDDVAASTTESQSSEESVNNKVDGEIDLPQSEVTGSLEIETDVCKEREESSTEVETVKSTDGQSDKDDIDDNAESDKTDRNESSVEASMETISSLGVGVAASSLELLSNQEAVDIKVEGEIELPHTDVTGTSEIETDLNKEREESPTEVQTAKSNDDQSENDDMHDNTNINNTDKNDSTETTDTSNESLDKEETDAKSSVEASMANIPSLGVGVTATSAELLSNQEEVDIKVEGEIELPHTEVTGTLEIENQNEQELVVETVLGQEQEESKNVATSDEATDIETTNDSKEDNTESDDTKKKDSIEATDISHAPEDKEETDSKSSIDANVEMTKTLEDGVAAYAAESQSNEVSVDIKVDGEIDIPQTEVSANLEIENQNKQDICVETLSGQHQQDSINVATSDEAIDIETTNDSKEDNTESDDTKKTDSIETTDINAVPEDKEEKDAKSSLNGNVEITSALEDDVAASTTESQSSEESVNNKVDGEIDLPQSEVTGSLEIETDVCKEREESSTEVETVKSTDGQSDKDDIDDNAESDKTDRNESSVEASMETISSLGVGVAASSLELLSNQEAVDIKVEGEIELPHTDVTGTSEIETDLNKEREESPTEVQTAKSNDDQSENDDMHDNTKIDNTDKNDSTETTDTSNESLDKEETDAKSSVEASMANIPSLGVGVTATSAELLSNQEEVDIKVEGEIELPHTEVTGTLEIENQNEQVVETVSGQEQEESKNVATSDEATDIETTNDSKEDNTESDDTKKKDSIEATDISHAPEDKEETDSKSSIDANVEMTKTLEDGVAAYAAESQSNEVSVDIKVDGEIDIPQTEVSANLEIANQNEQEIVVETVSGQEQEESKNVATSDEATDIETTNDSKEDNTESDDTKKTDSIETTDINAVPEDKEEKDAKSSLNGNVEITSALEDDVAASSTESQSSEESVNIKVDGEIDLPQSEVTGSLEIETDVCKEREESSTEVETVKSTDGQSDKDDIDDNAENDKTDRNESSVEASMETIPPLGVGIVASSSELLLNQEAVDIKDKGEIELPHTDVTGSLEIETDVCKEREESPTEVQTAKSNDDQSENDDMHDNTNINNTDKNDSTETTDTSNESLDKEETDAKSSVEASMANIPSSGMGVAATSAELRSNQEEVDIKVEGEIELPHTEVTGTLEIENQNEQEIVVETVSGQEQEESKNVATSDEATDIETTNDSKEDNTESDDTKKKDSIETTDISHAPEDKEETDSKSSIDANVEMTTTLEDDVAASAAESQSNEVSVDIKVDGDIDMPQTEVSANLEIENQNEQDICVETLSGQHQQESKNVATSDEATDIETTNDSKEDNTESDDTKKTDSIETTDINAVPEDKEEKDAKSSLNGNVEITSALEDDVAASTTESQSSEESVNNKVDGEIDLPQSEVTGSLEIETDVCKEREESSTEVETVKSTDGQSDKDDIDDNAESDKTDRNESSVEASMETISSLGVGVAASSLELLSNQEAVDIKVEGEIELPHTDVTGTSEIETHLNKKLKLKERSRTGSLGDREKRNSREESKNVATSDEATDIETTNDSKEDNTESDDTKKKDSIETTDISHAPEDKEETDSKSDIDANIEMTTTLEDGVAASSVESQSNEESVDIKVNGEIDLPQSEVSATLEIENQNEQEIVVETVSGQEQEESKNVATSDEATDIETTNDSKEDNTENINAVLEDKEEKNAKSSLNGNVEITFALEDDVAASSTESQSSEESVNIKVDGEIDLPQYEVTGSLEIETDVWKEREESSTEVETVKSTDGQSDKDDIDDNAESDKSDRNESSVEARTLEIETDVSEDREETPTEVETAKSTDEQSENDDMHDNTKIDNTDKNDSTETTDTTNESLDNEETDTKSVIVVETVSGQEQEEDIINETILYQQWKLSNAASSSEIPAYEDTVNIEVKGEVVPHQTEVTPSLEIRNHNEQGYVVDFVFGNGHEDNTNETTADHSADTVYANEAKYDHIENDNTDTDKALKDFPISAMMENVKENVDMENQSKHDISFETEPSQCTDSITNEAESVRSTDVLYEEDDFEDFTESDYSDNEQDKGPSDREEYGEIDGPSSEFLDMEKKSDQVETVPRQRQNENLKVKSPVMLTNTLSGIADIEDITKDDNSESKRIKENIHGSGTPKAGDETASHTDDTPETTLDSGKPKAGDGTTTHTDDTPETTLDSGKLKAGDETTTHTDDTPETTLDSGTPKAGDETTTHTDDTPETTLDSGTPKAEGETTTHTDDTLDSIHDSGASKAGNENTAHTYDIPETIDETMHDSDTTETGDETKYSSDALEMIEGTTHGSDTLDEAKDKIRHASNTSETRDERKVASDVTETINEKKHDSDAAVETINNTIYAFDTQDDNIHASNTPESEDGTKHVSNTPDETRDETAHARDTQDETRGETTNARDTPDETRDETTQARDTQDETRDETARGLDAQNETRDETGHARDTQDETRDETTNSRDTPDETRDETTHVRDTQDETRDETLDAQNETGDETGHARDTQDETRYANAHARDSQDETRHETAHARDTHDVIEDETAHVSGTAKETRDEHQKIKSYSRGQEKTDKPRTGRSLDRKAGITTETRGRTNTSDRTNTVSKRQRNTEISSKHNHPTVTKTTKSTDKSASRNTSPTKRSPTRATTWSKPEVKPIPRYISPKRSPSRATRDSKMEVKTTIGQPPRKRSSTRTAKGNNPEVITTLRYISPKRSPTRRANETSAELKPTPRYMSPIRSPRRHGAETKSPSRHISPKRSPRRNETEVGQPPVHAKDSIAETGERGRKTTSKAKESFSKGKPVFRNPVAWK